MFDPHALWTLLAAMEVNGFNKADLSNLSQAASLIGWRIGSGDGGMRDWLFQTGRLLRAMESQDTVFESFRGVPERA